MEDILRLAADWSDPWLWIAVAFIVYAFACIGLQPLGTDRQTSTAEHVLMHARRVLWLALLALACGFPMLIWSLAAGLSGEARVAHNILGIVVTEPATRRWGLPVAALLGGLLTRLIFLRYLHPRFSSWYVFRRVAQRGDLVPDIRAEAARFKRRTCVPQAHYQRGKVFIGLRENGAPMHLDAQDWQMWNQRMVGATQTGKGALFGVQLDQAIRMGLGAVFFDIKPDQHAFSIMQRACKETGRRLVTVDFNGELPGKWSPFRTGADREIKTRLLHGFNLVERGDTADFYRINERQTLESVFDKWNRELTDLPGLLKEAATPPPTVSNLTREMLTLTALKPGRNRGLNVERALQENAVVYVRSSATDPVVKRATELLLLCLLQAAMRLHRQGRRANHLFIGIDEVKFIAGNILGDMLATITGFDCHIAIAYQSLGDLKSVNSRLVNVEALQSSVENNCKMSLYYQPNDFETADYAARQSGTKQASRYRMNVDINLAGGEVYGQRNLITQEEVSHIHPNTLLMMPPGVVMVKLPGKPAEIIHTSWVPLAPAHSAGR